jgi:hypothetical protein
MPQIGQTSHGMADSDVVIPWTALASSQSKMGETSRIDLQNQFDLLKRP